MDGAIILDKGDEMLSLLENPDHSLCAPPIFFHEDVDKFDQEFSLGTMTNSKSDHCDGTSTQAMESERIVCDDHDENQSYKRRKLTIEQVEFLEKSFVLGNKLDPKRRDNIATELGLPSRQVAIWFQNRRARFRTKQVVKDFDYYKTGCNRLQYEKDALTMRYKKAQNENEILKNELAQLENISNLTKKVVSEEGMPTKESCGMLGKMRLEEIVMEGNDQASNTNSPKVDNLSLPITGFSELCDFTNEDADQLMMTNNLLVPESPPIFNDLLNTIDNENNDPSNFQPLWS